MQCLCFSIGRILLLTCLLFHFTLCFSIWRILPVCFTFSVGSILLVCFSVGRILIITSYLPVFSTWCSATFWSELAFKNSYLALNDNDFTTVCQYVSATSWTWRHTSFTINFKVWSVCLYSVDFCFTYLAPISAFHLLQWNSTQTYPYILYTL